MVVVHSIWWVLSICIYLGARRIFAQMYPNLPKKMLYDFAYRLSLTKNTKAFFAVASKKSVFICFSANAGCHFAQIFMDFAQIFDKCNPASYTSSFQIYILNFSMSKSLHCSYHSGAFKRRCRDKHRKSLPNSMVLWISFWNVSSMMFPLLRKRSLSFKTSASCDNCVSECCQGTLELCIPITVGETAGCV